MRGILLLILALTLVSAAPPARIYPVSLQGYIVTDKQLAEAGHFYKNNQDIQFQQKNWQQLQGEMTYFVLFAKNQGQAKKVSGVLKGSIDGTSFELPVLDLPRDKLDAAVWVIPIGMTQPSEGKPQIKLTWKDFTVSED